MTVGAILAATAISTTVPVVSAPHSKTDQQQRNSESPGGDHQDTQAAPAATDRLDHTHAEPPQPA